MIQIKHSTSFQKTIYFVALILLTGLFSCKQREPYTIYLAGDSTMAEKKEDKRPETGWGEHLQEFFSANVTVANHAQNGRSSKSFVSEGRWDSIMSLLKSGDYVFIEFGHNDQKIKSEERYSSPEDFYTNLCRYVDDTRSKKATPVLLTPIMRRRFDENGQFYDTHAEYPEMTRKAAADKKVVLLDMHQLTKELIENYGEIKSKELFLIADSAVWTNYPDGIDDNTHLNNMGAKKIAKLAVRAIEESDLAIKNDLITQH
ncbi:rhamnogalacturonan acetylesterase [Carboxylicivirga caseinilyticus]|uniref:rhamnogalacturonan acetylesterase n=1 Tax=Carboxylicivirga caseinilyticus TaxID=3417572 RepID=UPI003D328720|nr:rhamnogalacturonan acetylesterase [Marinilabiliaceae bacterium A049]